VSHKEVARGCDEGLTHVYVAILSVRECRCDVCLIFYGCFDKSFPVSGIEFERVFDIVGKPRLHRDIVCHTRWISKT
jgi:hypothetical protein